MYNPHLLINYLQIYNIHDSYIVTDSVIPFKSNIYDEIKNS